MTNLLSSRLKFILLFPLAVVVLFTLINIYFFTNTNNQKILNLFSKIEILNTELTKNYTQIQISQYPTYDDIVKNTTKIHNSIKELSILLNTEAKDQFKNDTDKLYNEYIIKEKNIENLKSHVAIYKNFILHYPSSYENVKNIINFNNIEDDSYVDKLFLKLMTHLSVHSQYEKSEILNMIDKLEHLDLKNNKDKELLRHFAKFSKKVFKFSHEVMHLSNLLEDKSFERLLKKLEVAYNQYFLDQEEKIQYYKAILFVLAVFMFILILIGRFKIDKFQNQNALTLKELNFQKYALDQHAIVSIADIKGDIIYVNDKFCEISQYTPRELIGKNHRLLKSEIHSKEFFKEMWKTISSGNVWHGEIKNKKKDGTYYWVQSTIVPFLDDKTGKPFQYISIRTDTTEHKELQQSYKEAKLLAEQANKTKSSFLANMSHELRTPLNGIIGLSFIAQNLAVDKQLKDYLDKIHTSGNILLKLINDILDFSKIEAGKLEVENIEFDLDEMLGKLSDFIHLKAYEKNIELMILKYPDTPNLIIGDPLRINQVLLNILGNAVKFTDNGEIEVDVQAIDIESSKPRLKFTIRDSGIGMSKEALLKIFSSFSQADSSITRKYGGTGLGLSITRELVDLMDGTIDVESEVGVGTTFTITFPLKTSKQVVSHNDNYERIKNIQCNIYDVNDTFKNQLKKVLTVMNIEYVEISDISEIDKSSNKNILLVSEYHYNTEKWVKSYSENIPMILFYIPHDDFNISDIQTNETILTIPKPFNSSVFFDSLMNLIFKEYKPQLQENMIEVDDISAKVLLVEDNEVNQIVAIEYLESFGCSVDLATNGLEAVKKVEQNSYDIVFMDVQMPQMDGLQATKIIRNELKLDIPIIAMTANAMAQDIEQTNEAGMNAHISKPIDPNKIKENLEYFVQK